MKFYDAATSKLLYIYSSLRETMYKEEASRAFYLLTGKNSSSISFCYSHDRECNGFEGSHGITMGGDLEYELELWRESHGQQGRCVANGSTD